MKPSTLGRRCAFTLLELVVALSLVIILAAILIPMLARVAESAREGRAKVDTKNIHQAVNRLRLDTDEWPYHGTYLAQPFSLDTSCRNPEMPSADMNTPQAGLLLSDGAYLGWKGPYLQTVRNDPWGRSYYLDPDYWWDTSTKSNKGCSAVAASLGRDGAWYTADDIATYFVPPPIP